MTAPVCQLPPGPFLFLETAAGLITVDGLAPHRIGRAGNIVFGDGAIDCTVLFNPANHIGSRVDAFGLFAGQIGSTASSGTWSSNGWVGGFLFLTSLALRGAQFFSQLRWRAISLPTTCSRKVQSTYISFIKVSNLHVKFWYAQRWHILGLVHDTAGRGNRHH